MKSPSFDSVKEYGERFTDAAYWRPYVEAVCSLHGLSPCVPIRAGHPGTNPVFLVAERWAVKFFTHFFNGAESYPHEHETYRLIGERGDIPAPTLLAEGRLFGEGEGWSWPYLVTTCLPGESLSLVWDRVTREEQEAFADALGTVMRRLHGLPLEQSEVLTRDWTPFLHFLKAQQEGCEERHRRWGLLPERLIRRIPDYLLPRKELVDLSSPPLLLHCDLNADHLLIERREGRWEVSGIIDFGDARMGDPLYEWVVLHLGLFRYDKDLLWRFFQSYDYEVGRDFARRAMCFTLLHEYNVLEEVESSLPGILHQAEDWEEIAAVIWGFKER